MMAILRERQDQLQKAPDYSQAGPDRAKVAEFMRLLREYQDWKRRKAAEIGVSEGDFGQELKLQGDQDVLPQNRS